MVAAVDSTNDDRGFDLDGTQLRTGLPDGKFSYQNVMFSTYMYF
jgi:hypothetical protein